ncbi:hypothetical protein LINGRAHAP2_LOCUS24210 [Linum grandiflorum]
MLRKWTPQFIPEKATMNSLVTWIQLSGLPLEYYNDDGLFAIASRIGTPIRIDRQTALVTRGKFARLCVEIDPLLPEIGVDGHWQKIAYEGIPRICRHCWHAGHSIEDCILISGIVPMLEGNLKPLTSSTPVASDNTRSTEGAHGDWMVAQKTQPKKRTACKTANQHKEIKNNRFAALADKDGNTDDMDMGTEQTVEKHTKHIVDVIPPRVPLAVAQSPVTDNTVRKLTASITTHLPPLAS